MNFREKIFASGEEKHKKISSSLPPLQHLGPVVMNEVDEKTFDVRSVVILICHDHHFAVTQRLQIIFAQILLTILQAHNLHYAVYLGVVHNLIKTNNITLVSNAIKKGTFCTRSQTTLSNRSSYQQTLNFFFFYSRLKPVCNSPRW